MKIELRNYQQEAVDAVYRYLREHDDNPCVVLPVGTGKSVVLAKIATDAVTKWNGRVLVLAHVKELLEQNAEKIRFLSPELKVGIYSAGLKSRDTKENVIVAGIQSVYNKACDLDAFDIVIVDEAHLIPTEGDGMYRKFLADEKVINPNVRVIGFTATPFRLKGGLICKPDNILNAVCYEAGLKEMIVQGFLSPLVPKAGSTMVDFDSLHIRGGEFVSDEMEILMNNEKLVNNACREIVELTKDRNAVLIFGVSVDHCKSIKKHIEEYSGEECAIVTGDTPAADRALILDRIRGKEITMDLFGNKMPKLRYLVNCAVLTTGFDAPNIDCVAILRPTASPGLLIQMVGRGVRLSPATGKQNCLVLDYGENILRHGPLDAIRVNDRKGVKHDKEKPAKKCPKCNALIETARMTCPACGYKFPPKELKHDGAASIDGLLTGQVTNIEYNVTSVSYSRWTKRKAENAPPTVMVEYCIGLNKYQREWLCPEHTGYARQKFEKWWEEHNCADYAEAPTSVEEVIALANSGQIKRPVRITVRHVTGEPFDRVVGYVYGDASQDAAPLYPIEDDEEFGTKELEYSDFDDVPF